MLTPSQIKQALQDRNLVTVASATGLPYHTVWRTAKTDTTPAYDTIRRLSDYLTDQVRR